jgi:hypothetical protein
MLIQIFLLFYNTSARITTYGLSEHLASHYQQVLQLMAKKKSEVEDSLPLN